MLPLRPRNPPSPVNTIEREREESVLDSNSMYHNFAFYTDGLNVLPTSSSPAFYVIAPAPEPVAAAPVIASKPSTPAPVKPAPEPVAAVAASAAAAAAPADEEGP